MNDAKARRIRDASNGLGTLISESCKIIGTLTGSGNFMICGEVEGDCEISGTVTLARSGRWSGNITADSVVIAGTVDGEINASGKVEIGDTARISGTISSDAIAVAEGAVINGVMQTTGRNGPTSFVEKRRTDDETEKDQ
jgi:cytoskeletal protein CcmA (bactofilin family)